MPKQVLKIADFGRGLNNNSDPSSLEDNELFEAQNLELSEKGTIKMPGKAMGVVKSEQLPHAGIGTSGTIVGWASDHSIHTDIVIIPITEGNAQDFAGKWAFNNAVAGSATGMGRVVHIVENLDHGPVASLINSDWIYVTKEHTIAGKIPSVWAAADDIYWADDAAGTGITQYGSAGCVTTFEPGPGFPESNQWLGTLTTDGEVSLYNYNSDRYFYDIMDVGAGSAIAGSAGIQDQALRIADLTFEDISGTVNKSKWYGYVKREMFQQGDTVLLDPGEGNYSQNLWTSTDADLISWSEIGVTTSLFDATSANPGDVDVGTTAGEKIVVSYWKEKDESGLNAYEGMWSGTYQFASCPIFDEKQYGEITELGNIDFAQHTLNMQVFVAAGTTNPTLLNFVGASNVNKWPGFGTTGNQRVTGMRIYFKTLSGMEWYILQDVDFVRGYAGNWWYAVDTDTETGHGMPDMLQCVLDHDMLSPRDEAYNIATDSCTMMYQLANTAGWTGRSGFYRVNGYYYSPVYVSCPDIATNSFLDVDIPTTNQAEGTYQMFGELVDENYQTIAVTDALSITFAATSSGPPPYHANYCCFLQGTEMTMGDGSKIKVEDVELLDTLLGLGNRVNKVIEVHRKIIGQRKVVSINGSEFFCTEDHPFKTQDGWKAVNNVMCLENYPYLDIVAADLAVGDIIESQCGGDEVKTIDTKEVHPETHLWNFLMNGDHTYVANGFIMHNKAATRSDLIVPQIELEFGPIGALLWGFGDNRMHQARFYVMTNNNWFTRLYKRYEKTWVKILKGRKVLQALVKPIWKYMAAQGKEFYNRPTGHPKTSQAVRDLKVKYPGMFEYYLIGSNARKEKVTHHYDVNIVPTGMDHTFAIWEDVLKTLYYVQENDQRFANPSICPQFELAKDYSGNEVYEHRDDEIDCYFYYDSKHPMNFDIRVLKDVDNLNGNLWHNKIPLIGDKWRVKGLDKIPYYHKEIK